MIYEIVIFLSGVYIGQSVKNFPNISKNIAKIKKQLE